MNLLPVVEKYQLGVIPYLLAADFLTGKYLQPTGHGEGQARGIGAAVLERLGAWGLLLRWMKWRMQRDQLRRG
jgi:aryl-alcohol dehydrogenase-like predicted oxidoreductase